MKEIGKAFKDAIWAILSPVIILGGIYSGFFTPTEAAVVSVVYSFIIGTFVYKELNFKGAYKAFKDAVVVDVYKRQLQLRSLLEVFPEEEPFARQFWADMDLELALHW